ncbi:MAG: transglycosylase domain-containing protein, partial [Candidatus Obscuribacterales bacterium]|nr:transglycosylase domain-containing protein [Candidatus Obscuribacterales bacterium]
MNFLENYNPVQTIQIYDRNDKLVVAVDGAESRIVVPLTKVSNAMKFALLAAEDHHFYEHKGVSVVGIFRAVLSNFTHGKVVEGGSTITQQLAKNLFFEGEKRTIDLKLAELIIAMSLENRFGKDKILELYLNEVYFGNNAYGIEQAARNYFGKSAIQLDQAESAFLAGIIRSPSKGGSVANRNSAMIRQRDVISKMLAYGFCSQAEANAAADEWLNFKPAQPEKPKMKINRYPYYVSAVIDSLHGKYNAASIERQGLKVYTNLDTTAQDIAERALAQGLARAPYGINQGALVTIRVADGAVLALVGGVGDYASNQWNCATNPHTAGSAFKPFVYLAGFEKGVIEEYGTVEDTPFVVMDNSGKEYKPKNYDNKFLGGISVAKAFAYSRNIPALRIGQAVGIDSVINVAERAGVTEPLAPELSLALGCSAVSPLHMANSYATLARGGVYMPPALVRKVETRTGRLLDYRDYERTTVFDRNVVAQIVDLMQDCVAEGTGILAKLPDRPVAGKTGTA